ncbi:MAG: hypothetical protein EHM40_02330 [Chloroflexi bacterium]|nr:MAG: hypothetical protein EHM40_02330 [Chloroflexota bacterium]
MITVDISVKDPKKPPKLTFPDRCVNCGKPKVKTLPVKLNTGAQKRGQMIQLEMDVPVCAECTAKENRIGNLTWIPFFAAGLLACVLVFIPVWLFSPEGTTSQTLALPYVLGAAAGLIAGMIVGTLVELGLKILFAPAYGKLLLKRPLTVLAVFNDSEDLIGLSARFADARQRLKLSFENDEIARAFVALNPQENL